MSRDKTAGTIGRKGVGFKSVYEVSASPQVLTVNGEGVAFSRDKTREWLEKNELQNLCVPHQWVPFFVPWEEARQQDEVLCKFQDYKTVVKLPSVSAEQKHRVEEQLGTWPPYALFAFRHVREIRSPGLLEVSLSVTDSACSAWELQDSRRSIPTRWRVKKVTEKAPQELRSTVVGEDEWRHIEKDGVGILIAAPLDEMGAIPTKEYLPIHVFYPTEQAGPVRLLLHAEFLVKSDRTAVIPIESSPFNSWVAERLACHVCNFVQDAHLPQKPSRHMALLSPLDDRERQPIAGALWKRIAEEAKRHLLLTDMEGNLRLTVGQAQSLSVNVDSDRARRICEGTAHREYLLHQTFDGDKEARKTLDALGGRKLHDQDLINTIADHAQSKSSDQEWLWTCWEWLAAWVAAKSSGEEHEKRIQEAKKLPIIPVSGGACRPTDFAGRIVTWRVDKQAELPPDWIPLVFTDDWFRNRIQGLPKVSGSPDCPILKLLKELGIEEPGDGVIQRAVGQAVDQYWESPDDKPQRFLEYMFSQGWYKKLASEPRVELQRCPVPANRKNAQNVEWVAAGSAYFGAEWGNDLLAQFYTDSPDVTWVRPFSSRDTLEEQRDVLKWLGVADCPRVIDMLDPQNRETDRIRRHLPQHTRHGQVPKPKALQYVDVSRLDPARAAILIRLLSRHWSNYYHPHSEVSVKYQYSSWRFCVVPSAWWETVRGELQVPTRASCGERGLTNCWLPDVRTDRSIGDLLSSINLEVFGDDQEAVHQWLRDAVRVRTSLEEVTVGEWKDLLSNRMPELAPPDRVMSTDKLRDKIARWYEACSEVTADRDPAGIFSDCPLLCGKAGALDYVAKEPRYLNDDDELARAFEPFVWILASGISKERRVDVERVFSVVPLTKRVKHEIDPEIQGRPLEGDLKTRFCEVLPYVCSWRRSKTKQDASGLCAKLKAMEVKIAPVLRVRLTLDTHPNPVVKERTHHFRENQLFLQEECVGEDTLAQALAEAIGVKSEADFYENLLRCTDADQRKKKLLRNGMSEDELERYLREWSNQSGSEGLEDLPPRTPTAGPSPAPVHAELAPISKSARPQETVSSVGGADRRRLFSLKDPDAINYVVGNPSGVDPGGLTLPSLPQLGDGDEAHRLTDEEKGKLEQAGRRVAERELVKRGYAVTPMPLDNPGFDLLAKKNNEELHVEVKTHMGRATVVELSGREYKEYLASNRGYRWELWNIEHLSENDENQCEITPYGFIPDSALNTRIFRVDLKKCQLSANSSAVS